MEGFLSDISFKEFITAALAILGYLIAFWQYKQKTKNEYKVITYNSKKKVYQEYITKLQSVNRLAQTEEQEIYQRKLNEKNTNLQLNDKDINLESEDYLWPGFVLTKLLKEYNSALDILILESSPQVLHHVNYMKAELSKLTAEIHLKMKNIHKIENKSDAIRSMNELTASSKPKVDKINMVHTELIDLMRNEMNKY